MEPLSFWNHHAAIGQEAGYTPAGSPVHQRGNVKPAHALLAQNIDKYNKKNLFIEQPLFFGNSHRTNRGSSALHQHELTPNKPPSQNQPSDHTATCKSIVLRNPSHLYTQINANWALYFLHWWLSGTSTPSWFSASVDRGYWCTMNRYQLETDCVKKIRQYIFCKIFIFQHNRW